MSDDDRGASARINDLEVRLAYQDKIISDLHDVVRSFSIRVQRLERRLADLQDSVGSQDIGPGDEKPPHY